MHHDSLSPRGVTAGGVHSAARPLRLGHMPEIGARNVAINRVSERGALIPKSVDVSDGCTRYRWELTQSEGLKNIRQALSDLYALGVATSW